MSNATTYTGKIISAHSLNLSSKIESVGLPDCDVKCMRCPWGGKSSHCLTQTLLFNLRYSGINLSKMNKNNEIKQPQETVIETGNSKHAHSIEKTRLLPLV